MVDQPGDLVLPNAIVNRIINEALPPQTNVSSEARKVIGKTATVFILYATATATSAAERSGKKTLQANDVVEAMQEMDFVQFLEPLKSALAHFRSTQQTKKLQAAKRSEETAAAMAAVAKVVDSEPIPSIVLSPLHISTPPSSPEKSGSKTPSSELSPKGKKKTTPKSSPTGESKKKAATKTSPPKDSAKKPAQKTPKTKSPPSASTSASKSDQPQQKRGPKPGTKRASPTNANAPSSAKSKSTSPTSKKKGSPTTASSGSSAKASKAKSTSPTSPKKKKAPVAEIVNLASSSSDEMETS